MAAHPLSAELLTLVDEHTHHFWAGECPPFSWNHALILHSTNFRLSPACHQKYDVVWFYETLLSDLTPGQIELVLDECLRLLGENGKLVLRYSQNNQFSIIRLKHFLGRRCLSNLSVEAEFSQDGVYTTVFRVRRLELARYRDKSWTLAILTQGKRVEQVLRFLESIRRQDADCQHQILVCGPPDSRYRKFNVEYIRASYREALAEISLKKNDIADCATCENLLIVHDRYVINDDFFPGFEAYGYDFDFVTIPQWYEDGTEFPAYCALTNPALVWSPPMHCRDLNQLHDMQYINGGLMIAKTRTLRELRLNPLLFWNQAEDVELAKHFRDHGLPPRVNVYSSATTIGISSAYTRDFRVDQLHSVSKSVGRPLARWGKGVLAVGKRVEKFIRHRVRRGIR